MVQQPDESGTFSPIFDYSFVHHVQSVTQEFLDYLMGSIEMQIHVTQHIDEISSERRCGTTNAIIKESIITGEPKGYEVTDGAEKPKSAAEIKCEQLTLSLAKANEENERLKAKLAEMELKMVDLEGPKSKTAE